MKKLKISHEDRMNLRANLSQARLDDTDEEETVIEEYSNVPELFDARKERRTKTRERQYENRSAIRSGRHTLREIAKEEAKDNNLEVQIESEYFFEEGDMVSYNGVMGLVLSTSDYVLEWHAPDKPSKIKKNFYINVLVGGSIQEWRANTRVRHVGE